MLVTSDLAVDGWRHALEVIVPSCRKPTPNTRMVELNTPIPTAIVLFVESLLVSYMDPLGGLTFELSGGIFSGRSNVMLGCIANSS